MNKMAKVFINIFKYFILAIFILFVVYIGFVLVTDYKPESKLNIKITNNSEKIFKKDTELSILTFNIGNGGMDKYQDSFLHGGRASRSSSKEKTLENIEGVRNVIKLQNPDLVLLQEVDKRSTRSFYINEVDYLSERIVGYGATYGINYRVPWVPVPVTKPQGAINSGLLILSKYKITAATRHQYPGTATFIKQFFDYDRCFLETRIPIEEGKELIIINTQLSVFIEGEDIDKQQLAFLKNYIKKEYSRGNYIVVGGDWNYRLPGIEVEEFKTTHSTPDWLEALSKDFPPRGFIWGIDNAMPTIRVADIPYSEGVNYLSITDGFLVSPNIEIKKVEGLNLGFEFSYHNPVKLVIKLK